MVAVSTVTRSPGHLAAPSASADALQAAHGHRVHIGGLTESHKPEWKRAGTRRLVHVVHAHLRHALEDPLRRLTVPLLILRGIDDRLSTPDWARRLTAIVSDGTYVELPGAHSFPWRDPQAWSQPVHDFATVLSR
jgi:pimeloyl-ACP methyl ester carboxylesterase